MAKINKIAQSGTGILMPLLQYRWRLVINSRRFGKEFTDAITLQVTDCNVDYKNKTLICNVEETINGSVADAVYRLVAQPSFQCRIDALDGDGGIYFSAEFVHSTVDSHNVEFNYAKDGTVKHELLIKFGNMITLLPKSD